MSEEATVESKAIARGGQPAWERTFTHPVHGELEFKVPRLPKVRDWMHHAVLQEQLAPGLASTGAPAVLAAAVAGLLTFMEVPVLSEQREEDPDNADHIRIHQVRYDPLEDEHVDFPVEVWLDFFNWRAKVLSEGAKEQVKNSSRATSGDDPSDLSPATTDSLPPTLA